MHPADLDDYAADAARFAGLRRDLARLRHVAAQSPPGEYDDDIEALEAELQRLEEDYQ